MTKVTFHRLVPGSQKVKVNGEVVGFVERSDDVPEMWKWQGRWFGRLSEAKAEIVTELSNPAN